ncbi:MAG TPA: hypothetical protein VHK69_08025 [Chitinophagaceae bacterium]|jgi:hypothetical protein|nr:hypothetical protein [Chitinophagaceae bacterium]
MRSFLQFLVALLTLSVLGWAAWQGYLIIRRQEAGLDVTTRSILVIGALVLIVCTFMITSAISSAAARNVRARQFESKLALYQLLLRSLQEPTEPSVPGAPVPSVSGLQPAEPHLLLLGSPQVIRSWNEYIVATRSGSDLQPVREKLLLSMRSDLWQPNDYFLQKEIKKLFTYKT